MLSFGLYANRFSGSHKWLSVDFERLLNTFIDELFICLTKNERQWIALVKRHLEATQHMIWNWAILIQKGSKLDTKKHLSDIYVAPLSCFHSLMHLKVGLIELVKKIFRCCIYIDVTTLPYDMKVFPKYAFGANISIANDIAASDPSQSQ